MKRNQSGFTLIEIAIVLVIIGLLLGGVLKGQELINSAKVKNLATDFRNIPVYIYGYQDKFHALPGDDALAASHVGAGGINATGANAGNGLIDGTWNSITPTDETFLFWNHVRVAGLVAGDPATGGPINSVGGTIGIQSGTSVAANAPIVDKSGNAIRGTYIICSPNILGKFAKLLDIQLDDGNTDTGAMMATPGYAVGAAGPHAATPTNGVGGIDDAAVYTVCMGV
jgi:prepilin-type N-terminal cleavage/methylation domain-containing protein